MKTPHLITALLTTLGEGRGAHTAPSPTVTPLCRLFRFDSHKRTDGPPPASWNRRNQRKDRKNFRRKIAAGL